jgi:hypothetical protein
MEEEKDTSPNAYAKQHYYLKSGTARSRRRPDPGNKDGEGMREKFERGRNDGDEEEGDDALVDSIDVVVVNGASPPPPPRGTMALPSALSPALSLSLPGESGQRGGARFCRRRCPAYLAFFRYQNRCVVFLSLTALADCGTSPLAGRTRGNGLGDRSRFPGSRASRDDDGDGGSAGVARSA